MASNSNHNDEKKNHGPEDSHQDGNHQEHHAHMVADFKRRFWVSLCLSVPIVILLPPAVGAVVISLSTVIVAINAKILKFSSES